jgi:hypothetical protein
MRNVREEIIEYVVDLLGQVTGVQGVYRNRGELPPREKTPGIIFLDGVVERKTQLDGYNFNAMPPAVFTLRPEIVLALTPRDDVGNTLLDGADAPVGPEMAAFETKILNAILNDDSLVAMLGDDGSVVYEGFDSDMRNYSSIGATGAVMIFKFAFSYVLDPSDLF